MDRILTEPSSQREDNRVWVWRYGDPVNVPFRISLYRRDADSTYVNIPTDFTVRFLVKSDLRDDAAVIDKVFHFKAPSIFLCEFSTEEVIALRAGKTYHVGVALYDNDGNFVRAIIDNLPLRVDKSTLSNSVF